MTSISGADAAKLHQEINQYINQKLTVINIAITTSSVVLGWVVAGLSGVKRCSAAAMNPVSLLLPSLLLGILAIILGYIEAINKQMHILSIYLVSRRLSDWEEHYQRFIQLPKAKGMRSLAIQDDMPFFVVLALGIGAMIVFVLAWTISCASGNLEMRVYAIIFLVAAVAWTGFWSLKFHSRHLKRFRRITEKQWRKCLEYSRQTTS